MFIVQLSAALVLTAPVYAAMDAWVGHRLAAHDLSRSFDMLLVMEPLLSSRSDQPADAQPVVTLLSVMLMAAAVAWLMSSLPNVVLGGGVLLTWGDGRFAWRRFLWGAWHWLLPFAALLIIFDVCVALILACGAGILMLVGMARASILMLPTLMLTALVYAAAVMTFDYARVVAVADETRNILQAIVRAVGFIAHRPIQTGGLYLLMTVAGLALMPLYAGVIAPLIPFEWGLAAIAAQQLYIAARLWTRLARWAAMMTLRKSDQLSPLAQTAISGKN